MCRMKKKEWQNFRLTKEKSFHFALGTQGIYRNFFVRRVNSLAYSQSRQARERRRKVINRSFAIAKLKTNIYMRTCSFFDNGTKCLSQRTHWRSRKTCTRHTRLVFIRQRASSNIKETDDPLAPFPNSKPRQKIAAKMFLQNYHQKWEKNIGWYIFFILS